jgi:hypothetical protein
MGCIELTIVGGVFEIFGFGLVAYELARIQRREFGEPEFLKRLRARLRRIFKRSSHQTVAVGSATATAEGALRIQARVRQSPGQTLEARIEALEKNFYELEAEIDLQNATFGGDIEELSKKLDEIRAELDQERRKRDVERRASLRSSVALQAWGTGLFVLGTTLSILGSALNC